MIIHTLTLENIRSYISQSVSFSQGSTLLSGDIGSGKSTLLLAIEFVFFGLQRTDLEGVSLLRNGSSKGQVSCVFEHNGHRYEITRRLQRSKKTVVQNTGFFKKDSQIEELTTSELSQKIVSLFEYPQLTQKSLSQIFRFTVYCPQEHMKEILLENTTQRLQTIRSIFGIDSYKIIKENATSLVRHSKEIIARLEGETQDLVDLSTGVNEQEEKIKSLTTQKNEIEQDKNSVYSQLNEIQSQKAKYEQKKQDYLLQKQKIDSFKIQESEKRQQLEKLILKKNILLDKLQKKPIEVAFDTEEYEKVLRVIGENEKRLSELERQKAISDSEQLQMSKRKKDLIRQLEEYEKNLTQKHALETKLTELKKINSHKEEIMQVQKRIDVLFQKSEIIRSKLADSTIDNLNFSYCPTCKQEVSSDHKEHIITDQKKFREEQEKMLSQLKESLSHLQNKKNDLEKKQAEYDAAQGEIIRLKTTLEYLNSHKEQAKVVRKEYDELIEREAKLTKVDISDLHKQKNIITQLTEEKKVLDEQKKQYDNYKSSLRDFELSQKELELLLSQIEQTTIEKEKIVLNKDVLKKNILSFDQKTLDDLTNKQLQLQEQFVSLKENISAKKSQLIQLEEFVEEKKRIMKKKQASLAVLAKSRKQQTWMKNAFIPLMDILERTLLQNIQQEFSHIFSRWFSLLIEDESLSATLGEDFTPIIVQNGFEMQASHLSGGEKTSLALAYRLALNKVINTVHATIQTKDLLILDEPTDGFSSEQLDRVRIVLDTLGVKQLLLVSHEQKMHGFVDHLIEIKKELNESFIQSS